MPRYEVLKPGFMHGKLYKPEHPRNNVVNSDMPLKPIPSWLKLIKDETSSQKKARKAKEASQDKASAEKAKEDKIDIDSVIYPSESSGVETL
jgi:hypothetical protein